MNKRGRKSLLQRIHQEQTIQKIAQQTLETMEEEQVDGDKIADEVFKKVMESITLEELERDSGN